MLRGMYVWRLAPVLAAEGGVERMVAKAVAARLSAIWVKVAEGAEAYRNVTDGMAADMSALVAQAQAAGIEVWGWHVPHGATVAAAEAEAVAFGDVARQFGLDGLIMDAESGDEFFRGGLAEAQAYGLAMRAVADRLGKPLAVSSHDIPQNVAGWLPKFNAIALHADLNLPQTYYGASTSVASRVDRAVAGNGHLSLPFMPVGAGFIGLGEGGCASAEACRDRAATFIELCRDRGYPGYGFWHWAGAPPALWDVLRSTPR